MVSNNEAERKQCPACAHEISINVDGKKIMQAALEAIRGKSEDSTSKYGSQA